MPSISASVISRSDLSNLRPPFEALITDVRHLASYNWIDEPSPTIAVPGSPSCWSNETTPRQLEKDVGCVYIAQNEARYPEHPLEPLFRALYITDLSFDIRSIDVVSDRNNVRKLLTFVDKTLSSKLLKDFTIMCEAVNGIVLFGREEAVATQIIGPNDFYGYGHAFEQAYTRDQILKSTGHHRIISYRLNGLNFVIRHETDGYVPIHVPSCTTAEDDLSQVLGALSLSQPDVSFSSCTPSTRLKVVIQGQPVPRESTLEIKTRAKHKPFSFKKIASQLWISQTPNLVRAYHKDGHFESPAVKDVADEVQQWEERNQKSLAILAALIAQIVKIVKRMRHAEIRYDKKQDTLVIRHVEEVKLLPEDIYARWEEGALAQKRELAQAAEKRSKADKENVPSCPGTEDAR